MKIIAAGLVAIIVWLAGTLSAQTPGTSDEILSPRPLADAILRLEHEFRRPVTYEEVVRVWRGDLQLSSPTAPKWNLGPKPQVLHMPKLAENLEQTLRRTLAAYHATSGGSRFEIIPSKYAVHVVQSKVRNESGDLVSAHSVLDARVSIPIRERTPMEHLLVLGEAITKGSGITTDMSAFPFQPSGFNNSFPTQPRTFRWGVTGKAGRDALIDLLKRSPKVFSWRVYCQSSTQSWDRFCVVNLAYSASNSK